MSQTTVAVDLFCGAGGTSQGLRLACEALGRKLKLTAINHWGVAIETHSANHPDARHLCETLDSVEPRKLFGRKGIDVLIASPECQNHSRAKGGKPKDEQSRATPWHVARWAEALRPRVIMVENVAEFARWGPLTADGRPIKRREGETFQAWLQAIRSLGYSVSHRVLCAADHGDATTRERLFVLAVRGNKTVPWPEPSHSKEPSADLFGGAKPKWRAAREVIDWTIKGQSIFSRTRPLKTNTLARIEAGLKRFGGEAFAVSMREGAERRVRSMDQPLSTITAGHSPGGSTLAMCEPFVMQMSQTGSNGPRVRSASAPLVTVTTADDLAFVMHATHEGDRRVHPVGEPLPTVTAAHRGELAFVVSYYGTGGPGDLADPLDTVTTKDRFALIEVFRKAGADILFRMLQPHELAAAHSFPKGYVFKGNRGDVVKQVGNSVPVRVSEALCRSLLAA